MYKVSLGFPALLINKEVWKINRFIKRTRNIPSLKKSDNLRIKIKRKSRKMAMWVKPLLQHYGGLCWNPHKSRYEDRCI